MFSSPSPLWSWGHASHGHLAVSECDWAAKAPAPWGCDPLVAAFDIVELLSAVAWSKRFLPNRSMLSPSLESDLLILLCATRVDDVT